MRFNGLILFAIKPIRIRNCAASAPARRVRVSVPKPAKAISILDFSVEAEALGFHSNFVVEHHFSGWNQVSAPLMLLMALAMRTTTLRLGTAVMVPTWYNPCCWPSRRRPST